MLTIRRTILILILQQISITQMYIHRKPLTEKIWSEQCKKNSIVLNDCNWCRCNARQRYDCKARVCEEIDMFGHFKDAIQEIDVGMEGHGSWRSKPQACTPGVHYRRGALLCVCDEDGYWPNPVCRDLFQILHSVELTGQTLPSKNDSCSPTKLYLVGCNVCFCPSSGYLDPQMCTEKECQEDDPVIEANQMPLTNIPPKTNHIKEISEIYAVCDPKHKYAYGCRSCDCLRNNRLLCGNCSISTDKYPTFLSEYSKPKSAHKSGEFIQKYPNRMCVDREEFKVFNVRCNLCFCNTRNKVYCTIRKCLDKDKKLELMFDIDNIESLRAKPVHLIETAAPPNVENCIPGTFFKRDCNICLCGRVVNGIKYFICSAKVCVLWKAAEKRKSNKMIGEQVNNCVLGTYYKERCLICHCLIKNMVKFKLCRLDVKCYTNVGVKLIDNNKKQNSIHEDVDLLNGYCQAMRNYRRDCNVCRCLNNGKSMVCTARGCVSSTEDLAVDIVPVIVENGETCPKGQSYTLDCNLCFCLSNGNAICTTADCSKHNEAII